MLAIFGTEHPTEFNNWGAIADWCRGTWDAIATDVADKVVLQELDPEPFTDPK